MTQFWPRLLAASDAADFIQKLEQQAADCREYGLRVQVVSAEYTGRAIVRQPFRKSANVPKHHWTAFFHIWIFATGAEEVPVVSLDLGWGNPAPAELLDNRLYERLKSS